MIQHYPNTIIPFTNVTDSSTDPQPTPLMSNTNLIGYHSRFSLYLREYLQKSPRREYPLIFNWWLRREYPLILNWWLRR